MVGTLGFYTIEEGSISRGCDRFASECYHSVRGFFSELGKASEEVIDETKDTGKALKKEVQDQVEAGAEELGIRN